MTLLTSLRNLIMTLLISLLLLLSPDIAEIGVNARNISILPLILPPCPRSFPTSP